jgi:hypothetical protein
MKLIIIGGGFLGQLLHTVFPRARVFDWRPKAPEIATRTIGPQYLWEPVPGLTNREYNVLTTIDGEEATSESILAYKKKVGKEQDDGDWRAQFQPRMKGYDCIFQENRVEYGQRVVCIDHEHRRLIMHGGGREPYDSIITTIPLYETLRLCGIMMPNPPLVHRPIYVRTFKHSIQRDHPILVDYLSDPHNPAYRSTIREGKQYVESLEPLLHSASVKLTPGKIYPNRRSADLCAELAHLNIWCLGRFASWSPDELAHETYRAAVRLSESECI